MLYYYILNLSYIFQYSSWYYCLCNRFNGCQYQKKKYCFICQFKLEYYPGDIEKIFDPREIGRQHLRINDKWFKKNVFNLTHLLVLSGIIILNTSFEIIKEINGFIL